MDGDLEVGFVSRRSPVLSRRGIVATSQPLAAQAGLGVLQAGGNAADAAVATAAALNVVEPMSTGIGGDCFALFYEATGSSEAGVVQAVNGSGRSPAGLTLDVARRAGESGESITASSPHAVTTPGAAAGWADTLSRHGRMSLEEALAPAIGLAAEGFPVSPVIAWQWSASAARLQEGGGDVSSLLPEGRSPGAGEVFANAELAGVLREVAEGGAAAFYGGRIGEAIVRALESRGGVMTRADLAAHASTFEPPISTTYRGYRVYECAPNGQGLTALLALNILEGYELGAMASSDRSGASAEVLHLQIEALRLAFADARWYVADPSQVEAPVEELLSKEYAAKRRALIDPARRGTVGRGHPAPGSDTVYLSVVDGEGNACSFINSNYEGFGTGIVPAGCGFALQNRGLGFVLAEGHPNALAPGKRPYHTIMPAMSTRADGSLHASFGVMGGWTQPQGHVQVFSQLADRGAEPQAALDAPRFSICADPPDGAVLVEDAFSAETLAGLESMGHPVEVARGVERTWAMGRGQVIVRDAESGVLWGGSDGRSDGCAVGW